MFRQQRSRAQADSPDVGAPPRRRARDALGEGIEISGSPAIDAAALLGAMRAGPRREFLTLSIVARSVSGSLNDIRNALRCCRYNLASPSQGRDGPNGEYLFPALWGRKSFNIGAGMARLSNAAGFIKANMRMGQDNTLSDADAMDVAAYFTRSPAQTSPRSRETGR